MKKNRAMGVDAVPRPLKILYLEDVPGDVQLAQHALRRQGASEEWRVVDDRAGYLAALRAGAPDVILANHRLSGFDGPEALQIARRLCPETPFIVLSDTLGEELAIEMLALGASDYVFKDRLARLSPAVQRAVAEADNRRALAETQAELTQKCVIFRRIIDVLPELIYAIDREGRITVANQAALHVFGRSSSEVQGMPLGEFMDQLGTHCDPPEEWRLMAEQRAIVDREISWRDPRGAHRWRVLSKLTLTDPVSAAVTGLLVVSRDVTDRRLLERELLQIAEREQGRVGTDLHDGLGQDLTGLGLLIKALEAQLQRENSPHLPALQRIGEVLRGAFENTRSLVRTLTPANLGQDGIVTAIEQLAHHSEKLFGLRCEVRRDPVLAIKLSDTAASHLYRIAQEAAANAAKHSGGNHVVIELRRQGANLRLSICDDGSGFDPERVQHSAGMGMRMMAYRARLLGGTLRAFRDANGGTRVVCRMPIAQNETHD